MQWIFDFVLNYWFVFVITFVFGIGMTAYSAVMFVHEGADNDDVKKAKNHAMNIYMYIFIAKISALAVVISIILNILIWIKKT